MRSDRTQRVYLGEGRIQVPDSKALRRGLFAQNVAKAVADSARRNEIANKAEIESSLGVFVGIY